VQHCEIFKNVSKCHEMSHAFKSLAQKHVLPFTFGFRFERLWLVLPRNVALFVGFGFVVLPHSEHSNCIRNAYMWCAVIRWCADSRPNHQSRAAIPQWTLDCGHMNAVLKWCICMLILEVEWSLLFLLCLLLSLVFFFGGFESTQPAPRRRVCFVSILVSVFFWFCFVVFVLALFIFKAPNMCWPGPLPKG